MFQSKLKYIMLCASFLVLGCQDILECVINRRPELPDKSLAIGHRLDYYYDEIKAEIKNEPRDDLYFYYFSISGNLPEGLDFYEDHRKLIIEGNPTEYGDYTFTVHLHVEQRNDYYEVCENEFNDCDGLCKESTKKTYSIYIN